MTEYKIMDMYRYRNNIDKQDSVPKKTSQQL